MKRILIIDDHSLLRRGLSDYIKSLQGYEVVGEADSYERGIEALANSKPDILLLDVTLPDRSGFEILKQVKSQADGPKVILFTMHLDKPYFQKAMELGADGLVTKDNAPDVLEEALYKISQGQKYFDPSKVAAPRGLSETLDSGATARLSSREREVLVAIVEGKSLTALAEELNLSVKTVSSHRARLLEKVGLNSNAELVKWAMGVPLPAQRA